MKILIFLCLLPFSLGKNLGSPVIELQDGKIQGISEKTDSGKIFYAFREIPYAMPPIGDLRFSEPVPPKKWNGILKTTKNTKICLQRKPPMDNQTPDPRENEDCLYINVFTPKIMSGNETNLLPVYVYIYGGMMIAGDPTEYNFQGFVDEDIVVVSMSFRSSTLGFLSTDDGVIPGNLGFKDQTLAFKWINKNIKQFGGDPLKVTIGGHSSGATSVGFHVLNTKSKGLFRAAILQSQSPLSYVYVLNATEVSYSFAERFDPEIYSKNTTQLLNLLRNIPADILTRAELIKRPDWLKPTTMLYRVPWGPMIENSKFENAVVIGPMYENFENGLTNHVPILTGFTNEEAINCGNPHIVFRHFDCTLVLYRVPWGPMIENSKFENAVVIGPMYENFENGLTNHVPILTGFTNEEAITANLTTRQQLYDKNVSSIVHASVNVKPENRLRMAKEIKSIYTQTETFKENMSALMQMTSDLIFCQPILNLAKLHSKFADVYLYQFSYKGPLNGLDQWKKKQASKSHGLGNVGHTEELPFLYYYRIDPKIVPSEKDLLMRKRLFRLWINFIKHLNPTPQPDPLLQNITWPKVKPNDIKYLDISETFSVKKKSQTGT